MALAERLQILIDLKADQAVRGLQTVGKVAEENLGKTESRLDKVGAGLTKAGTGMMAFAGVAGLALKTAADSASDLNEAMSKTEVVFGDAADAVKSFADDAAASVGMSKVEALSAASTFGTLGKAAGLTGQDLAGFSVDATTLAADLASFSNTSAEDAITAIGAALRGESEPIRQYGVLLDDATLKQRALSMGLIETTKDALTPAVKSQAAYAEILAQTGDAQGDFARTSDGMANSAKSAAANLENAKAALGEGMAPILADVYGKVASLAEGFVSLNEATGGAIGKVAAFGTIAIGTAGALSFIVGKALLARDRFKDLGEGISNVGTRFPRMAGAATVGMATATAAVIAFSARAKSAAEHTAEFQQSIEDLSRAADSEALDQFGLALLRGAVAGKDATEVAEELARANVGTAQRVLELAEAQGGYVQAGNDRIKVDQALRDAIDGEAEAQRQAKADTERATQLVEGSTDALEDNAGAHDTATAATDDYGSAVDVTAGGLEEYNDSLKSNIEFLQQQIDKQNEQTEAARAAADSWFAVGAATDDYTEYLQGLEDELKDAKGDQEKLNAIYRDGVSKATSLADSQVRLASDLAQAQGKTLSATEKLDIFNDSMVGAAAQASGPLRDSILDYIAIANEIPAEKMTDIRAAVASGDLETANRLIDEASRTRDASIKADADQNALNEANRKLDEVARRRTAVVDIITRGGAVGGSGSYGGARATGGPVEPGKFYKVTEGAKSELLHEGGDTYLIPGQRGMVEPLDRTPEGGGALAAPVSSGDTARTVNIYQTIQVGMLGQDVPRQVVEALRQAVKTMGLGTVQQAIGVG